MKKLSYLYITLLFLITSILNAQQMHIDDLFEEWDTDESPGCSVAVVKDGKFLYENGYGMANLEFMIPNSPNSVFRLASTSKQFTAACIILLEEKNKLDLKDRLSKFFPIFPSYADSITIYHLLHHTSGIRDYVTLADLSGIREDDFYTDDEIMHWLVNQRELNFKPGTAYLYSNSGYWLLGKIVEYISGKSLAEFAHEHLFKPLKMDQTHFHNDHTKVVKNRASGYEPIGKGLYKINMTTLDVIGDGGLFSTVKDLKIWDDNYYHSDVLSDEFWRKMKTPGVLTNGDTINYTLGLYLGKYRGLKTIAHSGKNDGYRTEFIRFPEQKFSVIILANRADANPSTKALAIADIVLKDYVDDEEVNEEVVYNNPLDKGIFPISIAEFAGKYQLNPGFVIKVSLQSGRLYLEAPERPKTTLSAISSTKFKIGGTEDGYLNFLKNDKNSVDKLILYVGDRQMEGNRVNATNIEQINYSEFEGVYHNKDLNINYKLETDKSDLFLYSKNKQPIKIYALASDQFMSAQLGIFTFYRNKDESIRQFILDTGRVKNLKFVKND